MLESSKAPAFDGFNTPANNAENPYKTLKNSNNDNDDELEIAGYKVSQEVSQAIEKGEFPKKDCFIQFLKECTPEQIASTMECLFLLDCGVSERVELAFWHKTGLAYTKKAIPFFCHLRDNDLFDLSIENLINYSQYKKLEALCVRVRGTGVGSKNVNMTLKKYADDLISYLTTLNSQAVRTQIKRDGLNVKSYNYIECHEYRVSVFFNILRKIEQNE